METHKLVMGTGIVIAALGALSLMTVTIYYGNMTRTIVELAIKFAILGGGFAIYNKGVRMRDER